MRRPLRSGLTFVEVLFAVMILAVGFIMVAAIFPVAIRQTQQSIDETTASRLAGNVATMVPAFATDSAFPADTGNRVVRMLPGSEFWNAVKGMVFTAGERHAVVPMYQRGPSGPAILYLVVVGSQQPYEESHFTTDLVPKVVSVSVSGNVIHIDGADRDCAAEGAYVIISADGLAAPNTNRANGQSFRLGNRRRDLDSGQGIAFDLDVTTPWNGLPDDDGGGPHTAVTALAGSTGFIVGRRLGPDGYEGIAQDVSLMITTFAVRP